jgi:queuine tRNA-ribosyltransferase
MLLSYANVQFYQELMARARAAIVEGRLAAFADELRARYRDAGEADDNDA